jgi:hypothetical protein
VTIYDVLTALDSLAPLLAVVLAVAVVFAVFDRVILGIRTSGQDEAGEDNGVR